jgi:hypothetical protein
MRNPRGAAYAEIHVTSMPGYRPAAVGVAVATPEYSHIWM